MTATPEELREARLEALARKARHGSDLTHRELIESVTPQLDDLLSVLAKAGWQLVPIEPTEEMLKEGVRAFQRAYNSEDTLNDWRTCYKAMLAAAPKVKP